VWIGGLELGTMISSKTDIFPSVSSPGIMQLMFRLSIIPPNFFDEGDHIIKNDR
jgi:hypothetical protein